LLAKIRTDGDRAEIQRAVANVLDVYQLNRAGQPNICVSESHDPALKSNFANDIVGLVGNV
jgi:hypothetical protein